MQNDKIKTSRASQTRAKTAKKTVWTPPSSLDAPPAPDGFHHRWIRAESMGFDDTKNMAGKLRSGYELVRADEYPDEDLVCFCCRYGYLSTLKLLYKLDKNIDFSQKTEEPFNLAFMSEPVIAIIVFFSNFKEQPVIVNSSNASDVKFPKILFAISAEFSSILPLTGTP